jgi:hypothetical protein
MNLREAPSERFEISMTEAPPLTERSEMNMAEDAESLTKRQAVMEPNVKTLFQALSSID